MLESSYFIPRDIVALAQSSGPKVHRVRGTLPWTICGRPLISQLWKQFMGSPQDVTCVRCRQLSPQGGYANDPG